MKNRITASAETLLDQATDTADEYLAQAIKSIDKRFGKGYAQQHPELVAAFMKVAAQDFQTVFSIQTIQDAVLEVIEAIKEK